MVAVAAGMLLVTGAADAAAAAAPQKASRLTFETARHLANKLREQQRQQRSLIFAEIKNGRRISSNRIDFDYRDRSTSNVLCKARIVVVQTSSSRSAEMRDAACHGIPSEDLSFEKAGRKLADDLAAMSSKVGNSVTAYEASLARCERVAVPRSRRADVDLLFQVARLRAIYRPLRDRLSAFAQELHDYHAADPVLLDGVDAWDRLLADLGEIPPAAGHPCQAVKDWKANGWTSDTAPADFGTLGVIRDEFRAKSRILARVARYLREQGIRKRPATAFTPIGLESLLELSGSAGAP